MNTIRIGIVDDQLLFRQSMAILIKNEPGFSLVLEAGDAHLCLEQLNHIPELPHILLMDLEMPSMDGLELNDRIHIGFPSVKIVVLSVHAGERLIARMIQSGASGYLVKNCGKDELIRAMRMVFNTGFYINSLVLQAIQTGEKVRQPMKINTSIPVELSKREMEILHFICKEYSTSEIAARLFLSTRTVEGHRNNLLQKTGCRNTAGLVLFAVKYNLYEVPF